VKNAFRAAILMLALADSARAFEPFVV